MESITQAITPSIKQKNFFGYLKKANKWQPVFTQKKEDSSVNTSQNNLDWRDKMTITPKLLVPAEDAFAPMDDIWKNNI